MSKRQARHCLCECRGRLPSTCSGQPQCSFYSSCEAIRSVLPPTVVLLVATCVNKRTRMAKAEPRKSSVASPVDHPREQLLPGKVCKPNTFCVKSNGWSILRSCLLYGWHVHMCVGSWGKGWCAQGGRDRTEAGLRQSFLFSLIIYYEWWASGLTGSEEGSPSSLSWLYPGSGEQRGHWESRESHRTHIPAPWTHSTSCHCTSWGCRSRQGRHPLCILHGGISSAALLLPGWILHGPLSRVIGLPSMCTIPQPANVNLTDSNFVKEAEDNSKLCWIESFSKVKNI